MTGDSFKAREQAGWREKAAAYDDMFTQISSQAIDPLLDGLGELEGKRLLDIACGPGHLAAAAARQGAAAQGVDFADTMLAQARAKYPALTFSEGDAENLPFPEASFDAIACNFGILHFEDADAALAEAHRVLREGGRYGFTVWCSPDQGSDFMELVFGAVQAHGDLDVGLPPAPPMFRFADPAECVSAAKSAGFSDPQVSRLELSWTADTPEEILELIYKSIVRTPMLLEAQTPEVRARIHQAIVSGASKYQTDETIELSFPAMMTVAVKA